MLKNNKRRIVAEDEVSVAPEAAELLFEAEDVAELVAEVTGQVVEVSAEGDDVTFTIGEGEQVEEYTVSAEGDEEIVESSRRIARGMRPVRASRRPMARRPVSASARRPMARRPVSASRRPAGARPVSASRKPISASTRTAKTIRKMPKTSK